MSRICIGICEDITVAESEVFQHNIERIVASYGYGVFFSLQYIEPLLLHYSDSIFLFSLADSFVYDNCERFLLADIDLYNGEKSRTPFRTKMLVIYEIALLFYKKHHTIEFFIGNSGEDYNDYITYNIQPDKLLDLLDILNLNTSMQPSIHIIVTHAPGD